MSSLNKVMLIGRLGRDPEVRYTPNGAAVTNVSVATSQRWKDKDTGEPKESTEWHRLVAYERTAEVIGEYLRKGSLAYFEGRLRTRKWQDKDGKDMYTTEIIVDKMVMLGSRDDGEGEERPAAAPAKPPVQKPAAAKPATGTGFDNMDDDIPFRDPLAGRRALGI